MPTPGEHKTVQARILAYAEAIGWAIVSREEAEGRRSFDPKVLPADRARNRSLFFDDLLDANPPSPRGCGVAKVREFNPRYAESKGRIARAVSTFAEATADKQPSSHRHPQQPGLPLLIHRAMLTL